MIQSIFGDESYFRGIKLNPPTYTLRARLKKVERLASARLASTIRQTLAVASELATATQNRIYFARDLVNVSAGLRRINRNIDLLDHSPAFERSQMFDQLKQVLDQTQIIRENVRKNSPIVFDEFSESSWEIVDANLVDLQGQVAFREKELGRPVDTPSPGVSANTSLGLAQKPTG